MMTSLEEKRVLALDPRCRGFGFAVLEGPEQLIDWGVKQIRDEKQQRTLLQVGKLFQEYSPDVLVLEDTATEGSRRRKRVARLIQAIRDLAKSRHVRSRCFSRKQIKETFAASGAETKHQIAISIALQLPELRNRLPRRRKTWMSEDERMEIFSAVALALTYYRLTGREHCERCEHCRGSGGT